MVLLLHLQFIWQQNLENKLRDILEIKLIIDDIRIAGVNMWQNIEKDWMQFTRLHL